MKKKTLLIEIQTEDLPSKELTTIAQFFYVTIQKKLHKNNIKYESIFLYYTSKKIAVKIFFLSCSNKYIHIKKISPSAQESFNSNKKITPSATLWSKKYNIPAQQIETQCIKNTKHIAYASLKKIVSLKKTLIHIISHAIKKIPLKKSMIWNTTSIRFSRPIRNIMILLDDKNISLNMPGITYKNISYGHFLMMPKKIIFTHANQYTTELFKKKYILIDHEERKKKIFSQIQYLSKKAKKSVNINEKLLEEITASVEWPVAHLATFKKKYLKIPEEVLAYTMENSQKYFPLYDKITNIITNNFIFISNVDTLNYKKIIQENEQILHSKLSNVNFFINTDQKIIFAKRLTLLKNISFHKKLGSLYEKTLRISKLSQYIAHKIKTNILLTQKAAILSKCDLTTNIVTEFSALQGTIGMYYALYNQENKKVALAIKEHYLPNFSQSNIPTQKISCVLSIADKIDTIIGIFSIGKKPTNKKDPFALRRAAVGIIRIIIEKKININLLKIIAKSINLYPHIQNTKIIKKSILNFIYSKYISLYTKKHKKKTILSVLSLQLSNLYDINSRINALTDFKKKYDFKKILNTYKRINNIVSKIPKKIKLIKLNSHYLNCTKNFLTHENKLIKHIQYIRTILDKNKNINYLYLLKCIKKLCEPIEIFFQKSFVYDLNIEIRSHRIFILQKIQEIFLYITNFSNL
ncbi:glycine--tRNA ligase subunit beta [Buchnera aphidicola]|uniref:Glycine--tRNA ligase beta subunit n=1 Tax=Buchnera aphidicola (Cinara cf. splendens/pseudotsugae 3390) TaxID=2518980 RepID=A0A451CWF9_9GAMM|nr:glycine--tRNA ligase subunit beta [Buchnera aphidicola]VFP77661.1 Glycine--tRNA ligase beta subunit [Buchnera aphidicola (Cinara cf. splendens/pseudotsugae 3390)]